jgi:hypothetical protein
MGGFISGLIGGYTDQMIKKEKLSHDEEIANKKARSDVLSAALASGRLTTEAQDAALDQLMELSGGGKGKKGGPDIKGMFSKLIGRYHQQQIPSLEEATAQKQQQGGGVSRGTQRTTQAPFEEVPPAPKAGAGIEPVPQGPAKGKVFKTTEELADEDIAAKKKLYERVTGPEKRKEEEAAAERERIRQKAQDEREDTRIAEQEKRDNARQAAMDARLKQTQGFQERMKRMEIAAANDRELKREIAQFRLTDSKTADALEKTAIQQRRMALTSTLSNLEASITQATGLQKSREAEGAKKGWTQFWKDNPDIEGAKQERENALAARDFLNEHKDAIINGKEDMDEMVGKANDIIREGPTEWSRSVYVNENPGKDANKAAIEARKKGMKVVP